MTTQVPHGPKNRYCPYNGKSMARVCHTCPKWIHLKGQHPQNEKEAIDSWDCADAWVPIMLTELIKSQRGTQAAVEKRGDATTQMIVEQIGRQSQQHHEAMIITGRLAQATQSVAQSVAQSVTPEGPKLLVAE